MKQITITVPDNCELKQDGNTYTIVEKEKKLTYEDILIKLKPIFNVTSSSTGLNFCATSYKMFHNNLYIDCVGQYQSNNVYFKSEELAEQAIEILGEDTIKLALCTDY